MDTKTKRRTPPREPSSHRLTDEKRTIIETLRKEGRSLSSIEARFTGRTETAILPTNHYQPITRKYLPDYATQRVLRWLLEGGGGKCVEEGLLL